MHEMKKYAAAIGLVALVFVCLLFVLPAAAQTGTSPTWFAAAEYDADAKAQKVVAAPLSGAGNGTAVVCGTTRGLVDDTSAAAVNTRTRTIICTNPIGNGPVYIGGAGVTAAGAELRGGSGQWSATLAPGVVFQCYAASNTTIGCTEYW